MVIESYYLSFFDEKLWDYISHANKKNTAARACKLISRIHHVMVIRNIVSENSVENTGASAVHQLL
jgi:hypothetical protein